MNNRVHVVATNALLLALTLLAALPAAADVLPVDLPPPAATPPAKDKPVKVYIMSGQSNSVGFGAIKPAASHYANVFLSADPAVVPTALPVGRALLVPFGLKASWKDSETGVVEALIDVPYDGNYVVHPGHGPNSDCVAELDGKVVYRLDENGKPVREKVSLVKGKRYPIRITSTKEGAANFWMEQVDLHGYGDLGFVIDTLGRFRYLRSDDGSWVKRPDVVLNDAYLGKGQSAPLSVEACGPTFGPELGFGFVMGTFHDEPVVVIKADIGNRSLGWDVLPPGTERYSYEVDGEVKVCPGYGENERTIAEGGKPTGNEWYAGKQYDDYTAAVKAVLGNFGERYPEYKDQGYEVAGFVWWQGHKDGGNPGHIAHYEHNLVNLIKAWRKEFNAPHAKWAIATVGFHGKDMPENYVKIAEAQLAVADPKRHPELAGTVKTIDTRPFWREPNISPKNQDYHYNHNAETYMLCGDALGRAMVELEGGAVEYPEGGMTKPVDAPPLLQPAEDEALAAMIPAITPIVTDRLLPEFVGEADSIPSYLRRGIPLDNILSGNAPARKSPVIESQLDQMIDHYNLCGIHTYDWKPFGQEMKGAEWQYFTFDPPEVKANPEGDRYRPVTLPAGIENWFSPDFDAAKAGWKTGKAPFGQKDGKQEPLIASCTVPHCGCSTPPATLWDKEVLLMRQTFDAPPLDENHRYRIVVGGGGHAWSGEGFALYLNGKLVSEATGGYYKNGGQARGAIVFDDLLPEFAGGKVTIAVKAFLRQNGHRNKPAAPSGHMSVWMESAELSPVALGTTPAPEGGAALPPYTRAAGEVAGSLKSVGSDTMNNLMALWAEGFKKFYPNVREGIEGKGSASGPPALTEGTCSFAPMSRSWKPSEIDEFKAKHGYPPTVIPAAIDMLVVFVHRDNPLASLSLEQIDAIFSKNRKGGATYDIRTWGDLGLEGAWRDKPISLYGRNSTSGTYGYFKEFALFQGDFKATVKEQAGSSAVVQAVASDSFGMGYSGIGYMTPNVRAIPLAPAGGGKAVAPTPEAAYSGEFPLARFLYLSVNRRPGTELDPLRREFLRYVLSRDGQGDVGKDGYLPVTAAVAAEALAEVGLSL